MTISKELFLAILSMDVYNRGYGAGIADGGKDDLDGLGEIGEIGNARLIDPLFLGRDETALDAWQTAGFYALAYTVGAGVAGIDPGTTVISYRGTDNDSLSANPITGGSDKIHGWKIGAGNWRVDQAALARDFFYAVTSSVEAH